MVQSPFKAGDAVGEVAQHLRPARGVHHLRVELHAVDPAGLVGDGRERRAGGGGDDLEAIGDGGDPVAMAHPDRLTVIDGADAGEQRALASR
jgi:hypothetical protein